MDKAARRPRCASCGTSLENRRSGTRFCSDECRLAAWALRKAQALRPHRRRQPRTWEVLDPAAVPREFLVISSARVDRALREGREVPGIAPLANL